MIEPERTQEHVDFNNWMKQCPVGWKQHQSRVGIMYQFNIEEIDPDESDGEEEQT